MKKPLLALPAFALLLSLVACDSNGNLLTTTKTVVQNIDLSIPASATVGNGEVERTQPNDDLKQASGIIKSIKMTGQKATIVAPAGTTFEGVREVKVFIKNQSAGANPVWVLIGSKTIPTPATNFIDLDMTRTELKDFVLLGADITYKYIWATTAAIPALINLTSVNTYEITVGP